MPEEKKSNCLAFLGVGCLVFILLAGGIGYYAYLKAAGLAKELGAKAFEETVSQSMEGLKFSEEEKEKVMIPVKKFAQMIRDGKVGVGEMVNV